MKSRFISPPNPHEPAHYIVCSRGKSRGVRTPQLHQDIKVVGCGPSARSGQPGARKRVYFCIMSWTNSLSISTVSKEVVRYEAITQCPRGPRRGKRLTVDASVTVLVGLANHLVDFVVGELLTDRGHDVTQLGGRDEAVVVTVEDLRRVSGGERKAGCKGAASSYLKGFPNLLLGVGVLHLAGHHGQELWLVGTSVKPSSAWPRLVPRGARDVSGVRGVAYRGSRWCRCCQRPPR